MKEEQAVMSVLLILVLVLAGVVTAQFSAFATITGGSVVQVFSAPVDLTTLVLVIILAGLLVAISLGLYIRHAESSGKITYYSEEKEKLKKYVNDCVANGWRAEQIKKALEQSGWPEDEVEEALNNT